MSTIEQIAGWIADADPTLLAADFLRKAPAATVKKLREGCCITPMVKDPDTGINPEISLTFNNQAQLIKVSWRQVFPDLDHAAQAFQTIRQTATAELMEKPSNRAVAGSKTVRSELSYRWRLSAHDSVLLSIAQIKARSLEREVVFEHTFKQPNALIAAEPATDRS